VTVAELVAASRTRQGLPPHVSDPATIHRLAVLLGDKRKAPIVTEETSTGATSGGSTRHAAPTQ
jgi:hypothetical protein